MKVFLGAKKDTFWSKVVRDLNDNGIEVIYWVGEVKSEEKHPDSCFFHEVVDAYLLENLYDIEIQIFDIKLIDLKDYYCYMKILDRADDLGGYSFSMRDRLFKEQLSYWYSVLSHLKPDTIIFSNVPHLVYDYPMYLVAKYLKINTMIFNVLPFANWRYVTDNIFSADGNSNLVQIANDISSIKKEFMNQAVDPYVNQSYSIPYYIKNQIEHDNKNKKVLKRKAKSLAKKTMIKSGLIEKPKTYTMRSNWRNHFFSFSGEDNALSKLGYKVILERFKKRLEEAYSKNVTPADKIKQLQHYVYVPLHYQPEATTAPLGGLYSDQIYMIEQLREWLPKDVAIIVKEHYSQFSNALSGYRGRYLTYWDKMSRIDNLFIAPMDYSQKDLILNSLTVATVNGTAGWEAMQYGKYSIVFGEAWYNNHTNSIGFEDLDDKILENILNAKDVVRHTDDFLNSFCKSLVKTDFMNYSYGAVDSSSNSVTDSIITFLNDNPSK